MAPSIASFHGSGGQAAKRHYPYAGQRSNSSRHSVSDEQGTSHSGKACRGEVHQDEIRTAICTTLENGRPLFRHEMTPSEESAGLD